MKQPRKRMRWLGREEEAEMAEEGGTTLKRGPNNTNHNKKNPTYWVRDPPIVEETHQMWEESLQTRQKTSLEEEGKKKTMC